MTEDVLQYIWQTQALSQISLQTTEQQQVQIYDPGKLNTGSGPDFSEARIEMAGLLWSGDIEIHTYASHWDQHHHNEDPNYDKVILHVVWHEDKIIRRNDGTLIPTIELKNHLDEDWYSRYAHLMNSISLVPCEPYLNLVDQTLITDSVQSALVNRLELKTAEVIELLDEQTGDWQQTALIWLFAGFGFKKNKAAFYHLGSCLELPVLRKLTSEIQIEAYLVGLSGLLPTDPKDDYVEKLVQEYAWLDKKYGVKSRQMTPGWWKFMRLRPANFPTLRLAQLAAFLSKHKSFMRSTLDLEIDELLNIFKIEHPEFWQEHYHFGAQSNGSLKGVGLASQNNLLINVVAVLLVAYGKSLNQPLYIEKAVSLLERIKAESNNITRLWQTLDISPKTAADSQGLIGLFNDYCKKSRCLSCAIGKFIIKPR